MRTAGRSTSMYEKDAGKKCENIDVGVAANKPRVGNKIPKPAPQWNIG